MIAMHAISPELDRERVLRLGQELMTSPTSTTRILLVYLSNVHINKFISICMAYPEKIGILATGCRRYLYIHTLCMMFPID